MIGLFFCCYCLSAVSATPPNDALVSSVLRCYTPRVWLLSEVFLLTLYCLLLYLVLLLLLQFPMYLIFGFGDQRSASPNGRPTQGRSSSFASFPIDEGNELRQSCPSPGNVTMSIVSSTPKCSALKSRVSCSSLLADAACGCFEVAHSFLLGRVILVALWFSFLAVCFSCWNCCCCVCDCCKTWFT